MPDVQTTDQADQNPDAGNSPAPATNLDDPLAQESSGKVEGTPSATDNPAYKGLQRSVNRKDDEIKRLRQQLTNQPQAQTNQDVNAVLSAFAEDNPEKVQAIQQQLQQQTVHQENQQLKQQAAQANAERFIADQRAKNTVSLRSIAQSIGVDPNNPSVDYGDDNMNISERIDLVTASAKEAAKPAEVVTPEKKDAQDVHSTQPGVTATSSEDSAVSDLDLAQASKLYDREPTLANATTLKKLTNSYAEAHNIGAL